MPQPKDCTLTPHSSEQLGLEFESTLNGFVHSKSLLLVCRWRHGGHVGSHGQKQFSPLGTKLFFLFFSRKISIVLTTNMAALLICVHLVWENGTKSFRCIEFWDRLGWQALLITGDSLKSQRLKQVSILLIVRLMEWRMDLRTFIDSLSKGVLNVLVYSCWIYSVKFIDIKKQVYFVSARKCLASCWN